MGLAAIAGGVVGGVLYFPFHTLAYFGTEDGSESEGAIKWATSGRDVLKPLLDWSSADTVYRTYGKVYVVVVLGFVLGLFDLRARRAGKVQGLERWAFRIAVVGYPLVLLGAIVEYWTPYLDFGFAAFSAPGLLITLIGSTLLGVALLRRRAAPRLGPWLLTLSIPVGFGLTALNGHLSAGLLPPDLAWILLGRWLWSARSGDEREHARPQRIAPPGRRGRDTSHHA